MKSETHTIPLPGQYTAGFLAGSFGLSLKQARDILAQSGEDRTVAAELARKKKSEGHA